MQREIQNRMIQFRYFHSLGFKNHDENRAKTFKDIGTRSDKIKIDKSSFFNHD